MEKMIKVGDTFEVVEIRKGLSYNWDGIGYMKSGGHTISFDSIYDFVLVNGNLDLHQDCSSAYHTGQSVACMFKHEVKPIGKLTITKLK